MKIFLLLNIVLILFFQLTNCKPYLFNDSEEDISFWMRNGRNLIYKRMEGAKKRFGSSSDFLHKRAKNVIFFIGDGMGLTTITSGRIYKGQKDGHGHDAEQGTLSFEDLDTVGLAKVYAIDTIVSDSSATATSYLTGVKARKSTVGVSGKVFHDDCESSRDVDVQAASIFKWAQKDRHMATGFVTTTRVTHGTEAPIYSFAANRDWEAHAPYGCEDIAHQLIHGQVGRDIRVILGGGSRSFLPKNLDMVRNNQLNVTGKRVDGKDLIHDWIEMKKDMKGIFVHDKKSLNEVDADETNYLLGLFDPSHLPYALDLNEGRSHHRRRPHHDGNNNVPSGSSDGNATGADTYPSLVDMTRKALDVLKKSDHGYLLFVESGKIDTAHHKNQAHKSLEEVVQLHDAVKYVLESVDLDETLIIVTADHSHTLTINGYAKRGTNILGYAGVDDDKHNYTTLMYGNGPGKKDATSNKDGVDVIKSDHRLKNLLDPDHVYKSAANFDSAKHGGEDVPVYSTGPGSYMLSGVFDQTHIAHTISFALCVGPHKDLCSQLRTQFKASSGGQRNVCPNIYPFIFILFSILLTLKMIIFWKT